MADFGIQLNDERGGEILGMSDFTIRKIFEATVPAATSGDPNQPYLLTIPGYDPDKCFVLISPTSYYTYYQGDNTAGDLKVPVFKDMGGEVISIIRYNYIRDWDPSNQRWVYSYRWRSIQSTVEVFKVFGNEQ